MDLIIILFVVVIIAMIISSVQEKAEADKQEMFRSLKKECPPHKWSWKPQPGYDGHEYISCDRCKMMPNVTTRDD